MSPVRYQLFNVSSSSDCSCFLSLSSFIGDEINFRQMQLVPSLKEVISACQELLEKHCNSLKAQESLCKDKKAQLNASRGIHPGSVDETEAEDRKLILSRYGPVLTVLLSS